MGAIGSPKQGERPGFPTPRKPMAALRESQKDQVDDPFGSENREVSRNQLEEEVKALQSSESNWA